MPLYDFIKVTIIKNKILFKNFSSLSLLQVSQYIIPLITFPYLVRVLGPDGYGLVAFATAFVGYFAVITDYGFNLSATRKISINRADSIKVSGIFSSVLAVKLLLFIVSIVLIIPIILGFTRFNNNAEIYFISFISVLGTTLFPVWFFQGMERMGYISLISIIVKILWVISVFVFVHSYNDILILVGLNSLSSLITGLIGLITVKYYFDVKFVIPTISEIKIQFIDGWHYFLSQASVSLYTISNVFILGLFASDTVVGYFSAADKIRQAVQNLSTTAGRTVFPHLSSEFKRSKVAAINFLKKYVIVVGSITVITCFLLFVFSNQIVLIVLGSAYHESVILLKIISFLPIVIFFSNVAGVQTMLNMGYKREFANIILIAGFFNIVFSFIIVPVYLSIGTAIMVLLTEILVTVQMMLFLKKKNIHIFKNLLTNI
jgi:O-antigen/teichoic acid export membrane protein